MKLNLGISELYLDVKNDKIVKNTLIIYFNLFCFYLQKFDVKFNCKNILMQGTKVLPWR